MVSAKGLPQTKARNQAHARRQRGLYRSDRSMTTLPHAKLRAVSSWRDASAHLAALQHLQKKDAAAVFESRVESVSSGRHAERSPPDSPALRSELGKRSVAFRAKAASG